MKALNMIFQCLSSFLLVGFLLSPDNVPPEELIVNKILEKAAKKFENQYNMSAIGNSVSMPSGVIKSLGIDFQICRILSKEELRKILKECSEQFLSIINSTIELKPYMEEYPFSMKRVNIVIFVVDSTRNNIYHPFIDTAQTLNGQLKYTTTDQKDPFQYLTKTYESYEEALKNISPTNTSHNK